MQFKQVIGQQPIKQQLIRMVHENRVSHALLFAGNPGTGKLAMALALAQYLNCTNKNDDDACGQCPSCRKMAKLIHPDLHFVFPVHKADNRELSDNFLPEWRKRVLQSPYFDLTQWMTDIGSEKAPGTIYTKESGEIVRKLSMKSYEAEYKTMIIWLPEKMRVEAANKLLKLIEEPPAKTIFLLVSNQPAEVLGTILSRSQQIRFPRLADKDLVQHLTSVDGISAEQASFAARLANGSYLAAREVIAQSDDQAYFFDRFIWMMRWAYQRKIFELLQWVDDLASQNKVKQKNFLDYAIRMIRENYVMNFGQADIVYLNSEENEFSQKFARFINDRTALPIMEEMSLAIAHLEQNGNAKIIFTDLVLKMIILLKE
ncbi:DNA polymerase-3 subunit delta' [Breznakibacter xylanolyticus]|uniref:DNA polymerase-3 subunit delta n=1 Tax=Breznakibacter xylanolyticus TaxID=990 RepID=A0A2W7NKG1_9BACT|nr:DNA polymerase III subunit delta' [Breznakibacter xylanolyticus]MBN2744727.1 DNA polymerase III subunit delta' [Marinilabiliaceae bacterium]PZX18577.1 DNA polymerase-3 subunit delta' [Breznakibacter xylanolyticus]